LQNQHVTNQLILSGKKKMKHSIDKIIIGVLFIGIAQVAHSSVIISSSNLSTSDVYVDSATNISTGDVATASVGSLPWTYTNTASASQNSSASATYNFSTNAFDTTFSHNPADSKYTGPLSMWGSPSGVSTSDSINFNTTDNMNYAVSGNYAFTGGSGDLMFDVLLKDQTTNTILFYSRQWSIRVGSESFTVGLQEGMYYNHLEGNSTGLLIAGHDYLYRYQLGTSDYLNGSSLISASGQLHLGLAALPSGQVPAPFPLALIGLGLAVLGWTRCKT